MHICNGFVLVLLGNSIEFFELDQILSSASVTPSHSITLQKYKQYGDYIAEGRLMSKDGVDFRSQSRYTPSEVLVKGRGPYGEIIVGTIAVGKGTFELEGLRLYEGIEKPGSGRLTSVKFFVGSSQEYQIYLAYPKYSGHNNEVPGRMHESPSLMVASVHTRTLSSVPGDSLEGADMGDVAPIDRAGLPLLHFLSCLDFDDSAGLILFATSRGELCLGSSVESALVPGSLNNNLPTSSNADVMSTPKDLKVSTFSILHYRELN